MNDDKDFGIESLDDLYTTSQNSQPSVLPWKIATFVLSVVAIVGLITMAITPFARANNARELGLRLELALERQSLLYGMVIELSRLNRQVALAVAHTGAVETDNFALTLLQESLLSDMQHISWKTQYLMDAIVSDNTIHPSEQAELMLLARQLSMLFNEYISAVIHPLLYAIQHNDWAFVMEILSLGDTLSIHILMIADEMLWYNNMFIDSILHQLWQGHV